MNARQAGATVTAATAVSAGAAVAAGVPGAVAVVLGVALLAAPGCVWAQVLIPGRVTGLERAAVAVALALAAPVLGGLILQLAGLPLQRAGWAGLLAALTLAGDAVLVARERRREPALATPVSVRRQRSASGNVIAVRGAVVGAGRWLAARRRQAWHAAGIAAAALIAAAGVGIASHGAAIQHYPGFTQLWLVPARGQAGIAEIGVRNNQGASIRYRLVLTRGEKAAASWTIVLASGQTWLHQVAMGRGALTADLYRPSDLTRPYRQVTAADLKGKR